MGFLGGIVNYLTVGEEAGGTYKRMVAVTSSV